MHIDYFWLVNLWLLSFLVAMMLYSKWTAPILDRWNNLLRRSKSFVLLSAAVFFISLGMFFCEFYVYEQPSNKTEIQDTNSPSSKASKPRYIFSEKGDPPLPISCFISDVCLFSYPIQAFEAVDKRTPRLCHTGSRPTI